MVANLPSLTLHLRSGRTMGLALAVLLLLSAAAPVATGEGPATPPPFPSDNMGGELLGFSAAAVDPGASGSLQVTVSNPASDPFGGAVVDGALELQVYEFSYEGSGQNLTRGDSWAVGLGAPGGSTGPFVNLSVPTVDPGSSTSFSLPVSAPASASAGSYFVRDRFNFTAGGKNYVAASRGFFSDALWREATLTDCGNNGNCTPVLNLTDLNVSGVTPETAISVNSTWPPYVLGALLGGALVLAGAAGYVAFRRNAGARGGASRAGARSTPRRKKAESALGKSRTNDGD